VTSLTKITPTGDAALLSLFNRRSGTSTQTGLSLSSEGVGLAAIHRQGYDAPPRLEHCEFIPADSEQQTQLLQQLSNKHHLNKTPCISVAESDSFSLLLVEAPEVKAAELKAALRWKVKDLLPFHVDDAVIDVFDIPGQQQRGRAQQMYVVASRLSTVQEHISLLEERGVQLAAIDIPELVLRNIAMQLPEAANGVAMLHVSANSGTLIICRADVMYLTRNIKLGYRQLANLLPQRSGQDEFVLDEAEPTPEALLQAIDNIVLEIQRSLDYCESHFSLPPVASLVLAPMVEEIPPLMPYLSSNLGIPVRMLDLNAVLDCPQHLDDALQSRCLLAIGAALRQEERAL
jgi:MSHA biogenesis protein MshI